MAQIELGAGPAGTGTLAALWRSRWLYLQWVKRDFLVRYRQSLLGAAWAVVQPALLLAVYGIVFVRVLHVHTTGGSYVAFAFCGLVPWTFFSNAVSWSMPSLSNAAGIIRQVYFPRSLIPMAACGVVVVDLILSTAILVAIQAVSAGRLFLATLALLPIYLALVMATAAVANLAAILGAFVRDIRFALPLVLQLLFIATPIMYPASRAGPGWSWVFRYNPMARAVGAVRQAVTAGRWPSAPVLAASVAVSAAALALTIFYSAAVEDRLPDLL